MSELYNRIQILIETHRFDDAHATIVQALSDYPESGHLYQQQAVVFLQQNKNMEALEAINVAIGYSPEDSTSYFLKSSILLQQRKKKESLAAIEEALNLDPEDADILGQKAQVLVALDKREEAIVVAKQGKALDPENHICNNVLSMALGSLGHLEEAKEVLGSQLADNPEDDFTHSNMGYTYLRDGNVDQAKQHFAEALRIDPTDEYAREGMLLAMKASNFIYRKLLDYHFWMEQKSAGMQWAWIIGFVVIAKIIPFLMPIYMIFVMFVWFTPPLADAIIYFDKHGKYLMSGESLSITKINIGLLAITFACIPLCFISFKFGGLGFATFFTMLPVYGYGVREMKRNRIIMVGFAAVFLGLGLFGLVANLFGISTVLVMTALWLLIIAYSWLAGIFDD